MGNFFMVRGSAVHVSLLWIGLTAGGAHAQGNFDPLVILETQGGSSLVSSNLALDLRGVEGPVAVEFAFGFATEETVAPGSFLDAFTISFVSVEDALLAAIYLTVDAGGLIVAPPTPGTIPLDSSAVSLTPAMFPPGLTEFPQQTAFQVLAPVPNSLLDQQLTVYFDLFNNGDPLNSLAWASHVSVIPEPHTGALALSGVALWLVWLRRGRKPPECGTSRLVPRTTHQT